MAGEGVAMCIGEAVAFAYGFQGLFLEAMAFCTGGGF